MVFLNSTTFHGGTLPKYHKSKPAKAEFKSCSNNIFRQNLEVHCCELTLYHEVQLCTLTINYKRNSYNSINARSCDQICNNKQQLCYTEADEFSNNGIQRNKRSEHRSLYKLASDSGLPLHKIHPDIEHMMKYNWSHCQLSYHIKLHYNVSGPQLPSRMYTQRTASSLEDEK